MKTTIVATFGGKSREIEVDVAPEDGIYLLPNGTSTQLREGQPILPGYAYQGPWVRRPPTPLVPRDGATGFVPSRAPSTGPNG